jgi:hypothetical protein
MSLYANYISVWNIVDSKQCWLLLQSLKYIFKNCGPKLNSDAQDWKNDFSSNQSKNGNFCFLFLTIVVYINDNCHNLRII